LNRIFIGSHSLPPPFWLIVSVLHIVTIEDTSDNEDGDTLQERVQLRYRFNRPELPNIPLIVESPASLEASIYALPRRPRNVAVDVLDRQTYQGGYTR
jgi:hypothetical protein